MIQGGLSDSPSPAEREAERHKRKREVRAETISARRLKRAVALNMGEEDETLPARPQTRADCVSGPRPCPWVSCAQHLFLDVLQTGSLKLNFPDLEPHEMKESCALDVADRGGHTLEEVADLANLTRERIRQLESKILDKLKAALDSQVPEDGISVGRVPEVAIDAAFEEFGWRNFRLPDSD